MPGALEGFGSLKEYRNIFVPCQVYGGKLAERVIIRLKNGEKIQHRKLSMLPTDPLKKTDFTGLQRRI